MISRLAALVAAGVLVVTGLATGPANAAEVPTVAATPECGKVTITATNLTGAANLRLQYQADRGPVRTVVLAANGTTAVPPIEFREDSGRHLVRWRLWGGPERDWDKPAWEVGNFTDFDPRGFKGRWADTIRVESNCRPDWVRADEPTAKNPACDAAKGKLTIPSKRGVYYRVNGKIWRAGTFDVRPGRYVVTAYARDGYRLVGDPLWRLKVERAEACPSPSPTPTVTPTVTVSPTPTDNPDVREVTPEAPTLTQATCDDKTASVSIPEQDGVIYKTSGGTVLEQGKTYTAKPGSVTVTFEAEDGYKLAEGADTEWTREVAEAPTDCPTATPTTTTTHVTVVNNIPVPAKVDTGLGGLARH